ncbi:MAG: nickel pincer cofactor biosynthesis protein LarB [Sorangiineae bacterium]|nr:nickel pincer cofactor biosynthesis protein LarB [Polyangiaceae bacterium]MEB2321612.1 nickel pincer cofactor biosynthesis protein LarB [Sorangiineae bacterium]
MDPDRLRELLEAVKAGGATVDAALDQLRKLPFFDLGYARVDHHRALRQGMPEVILGEAKTPEQIAGIAGQLARAGQNVLVTRVEAEKAARLRELYPELTYRELARVVTLEQHPPRPRPIAAVPVVTAGTSDIPVAEEACETLRLCGIAAERVYDVGVAGIHRLVGELDLLSTAAAVIVVAGMEGALASVVGGLLGCPVIAVPTSIGYGASLGGLTALFGMLSGCASGVTVVNIDNGFGAAMAVARMAFAREHASGAA